MHDQLTETHDQLSEIGELLAIISFKLFLMYICIVLLCGLIGVYIALINKGSNWLCLAPLSGLLISAFASLSEHHDAWPYVFWPALAYLAGYWLFVWRRNRRLKDTRSENQ